MTTLETMYAPQVNSPTTSTVGNISSSATSVTVLDASVLPAPPMLLVLGGDTEHAETVLATAKNSNTLTITRAVEGTARAWEGGTAVGRLFTAKDLRDVQNNISALNTGKAESSAVPTASTSTPNMDGTGSAGSGTTYARGNHVHPTDTTRQAKITASGILKGNGSGGVTAATSGTDYALPSSVPTASTSTPQMDGAGSYGSGTSYARSNHVHPTDTSRQAKITANGLLKGDGSGGVTAATAGTDYQAPLTAGTDYATPASVAACIPSSEKGANSGVATLDAYGKVMADQATSQIINVPSDIVLSASHNKAFLFCQTSNVTITIPTGLPAGFEVTIYRWQNSYTVTLACASTVITVNGDSTNKTISKQFGAVWLKRVSAASDAFVLLGDYA